MQFVSQVQAEKLPENLIGETIFIAQELRRIVRSHLHRRTSPYFIDIVLNQRVGTIEFHSK
ncbi:hypothetical protein [Brucella sp. 10RB9210]|uniref:hypothetical protein n=1 Tax=unclassified Brucella TaxID=2632610 RepID=UPI000972E9C9|nr:hypothetical protein BKD03_06955 [Brucella sp. 09RB8471]